MSDDVDVGADGAIPSGADAVDAELRTFVIADVRGYTSFTQRHGDEMAAKLAGKFARVARDVVESHIGTVLELRGDEALCVFVSPRQAVRAAVALQRRFVDETRWDPELPLPVGIGIDVGEAVPVEGGYRSGALNMAARLCSIAKPGEIIATQELTHLARRLDGMSYLVGSPVRLKGLTEPVRPVRVVPEGENPVLQLIALGALPPKPEKLSGPEWLPPSLRRRPWLAPAAGLLAVVLVAVMAIVLREDSSGLDHLGENVAAAVDPSNGRLLGETPVGAAPSAVVFGAGSVWVANAEDGTVSRIDPVSRQVERTIEVENRPTALAFGGGTVWVANNGSGSLSAIDASSNRVTSSLPVGSGPSGLAYDDGVVWVADVTASTLLRVDVASATVQTAARVGSAPMAVAVADGRVWVSNSGSNTVSEYDPKTQAVVQTVNVGQDPRAIAAVGGDLWVVNNLDGTVSRIDPGSGSEKARLQVGAGPVAVAGSGDTVWVAAEAAGELTQIDAARAQVVRHVPTASTPTGLAILGDKLWATASSNPALHRGGTLTTRFPDEVELDPARGYFSTAIAVDSLLYDGLLGLRRVAGAAGGAVVPDLAQRLPDISDDGRTYTFQLRPGVRWSDGKPVTGADARRGLERAVAADKAHVGWPLYEGIVGTKDCTPKLCDLSQGIVTDDAAGTVTIRLSAPDADFQYKLALVGAVAVPAGTPVGELHERTLPSTGPYMVASQEGTTVSLVRNPRFRAWSPARPSGYVDRITVTVDKTGVAAPTDDVDWTTLRDTDPGLGGLRAQFGSRLHLAPQPAVAELALNTSVPPFDDVRARRALAFAIDREAVAANWRSPGTVTCQFIPPGLPGYRPYCPYTLRRDSTGVWHGLDLLTAQRLVRQSGTRGEDVTVMAPIELRKAFAPIVRALRAIHYHPHFLPVRNPQYFPVWVPRFLNGTGNAAFDGWGADYPSGSNFIQQQTTCASDIRRNGTGGGFALFCDHSFDKRVDAALRAQVKAPASAASRWAALDREITDKAPFIPLLNFIQVDVASTRLHNLQRNPILNNLLDQAWVR